MLNGSEIQKVDGKRDQRLNTPLTFGTEYILDIQKAREPGGGDQKGAQGSLKSLTFMVPRTFQ